MFKNTSNQTLADTIRDNSRELTGSAQDYDSLLDMIGNARFVLIGEASHGTHEFYRERAEITKCLIREKGFNAIGVEADWPDAYRINRYVHGSGDGETAIDSLSGFTRFPTWMWRNADVLDFVGWLRDYNDHLPHDSSKAGFYGLDLYSLYGSIQAVLAYLDKVDPEAAKRARYRYSCLEHYKEDTQGYGYAANFGLTQPCEDEVVAQLVELQSGAANYENRDGRVAEDEYFFAQENARLVKNAEEYYRTMFHGRVSSWNLRDQHMAGTLDDLVAHLDSRGGVPTKVVVWAHNSHLGDARATQMGQSGEWNIGQLVRQKYGREAVLVGQTTYTGSVTAASDWDAPVERRQVRPGMEGSYEMLFHEVGIPRFFMNLRDNEELRKAFTPMLERAIGVIYLPQSERWSHYFEATITEQFDAVIHIDETRALEPLERTPAWQQSEEVPETYPTAV